jgi:DNA ligase 1
MVQSFAHLCEALGHRAQGSAASAAPPPELVRYLEQAEPADAAWAVHWLLGKRLRPSVSAELLRATAQQLSGLPDWLFAASLKASSDLAECISLVLPPPTRAPQFGLAHGMEQGLLPLRGMPPAQQSQTLARLWSELDAAGRELTVQILASRWRSPVSALQVQRALAQVAGSDPHTVALRLPHFAALRRTPNASDYVALLAAPDGTTQRGQPHAFPPVRVLLADAETASLGEISDWQLTWQHDGQRAQLVRRAGSTFIWSEQGELWTGRVPELARAAAGLPDGTVLFGDLLAWPAGAEHPLPAPRLQQRLQRKALTPQLLRELPCVFLVSDVGEWQGADTRQQPLQVRQSQRLQLQQLLEVLARNGPMAGALRVATRLSAPDWAAAAALRHAARLHGAAGISLQSLDARCFWPTPPLQVTAVLLYAQAGYGAAASASNGPFSSYTFGLWNRAPRDAAEVQAVLAAIAAKRPPPADPAALRLVPVAKAHSGLSAAELAVLDQQVRTQALEKFGPVRSLLPSLVVELAFDSIRPSAVVGCWVGCGCWACGLASLCWRPMRWCSCGLCWANQAFGRTGSQRPIG